jgi:hypothetical protein
MTDKKPVVLTNNRPTEHDGSSDSLQVDGPITGTAFGVNVTQSSHGFVAGDVVKYTGGAYAKATADSVANAEVVGIVSVDIDTNNFTLVTQGIINGLSSLTENTVYFLDPVTAGAITATEPSTLGQVVKPLLMATGTTSGIFNNMRGKLLQSAGGGAISNVVEDASPQLGGDLDLNGNQITSPDGTDLIDIPDGSITLQTASTSRLDITDSGVRLGAANARVTTVLDEDAMSSNSATALATQQSIKAYSDSGTSTLTNKTFDANGTGNSLSNVDVADLADGTDGELITWDASGNAATVAAGTATHVLTSNGAGAAPTFQASAGGGGDSWDWPGDASQGSYFPTIGDSATSSNVSLTANRIYYYLTWIPADTYNRLGARVETSDGSAVVYLAVYEVGTDGEPGARVVSSTIDVTGTGDSEGTISETLGGWYFVAAVSDTSISNHLDGFGAADASPLLERFLGKRDSQTTINYLYHDSGSPPPDPASAVTGWSTSYIPNIWLRIA